jgi:hypothetical protein
VGGARHEEEKRRVCALCVGAGRARE